MSSSKKKKQGLGLWDFLTQNNRSPTTLEVFVSIAKADYLLGKIYDLYRQQENFENETKRIEQLRRIMLFIPPHDERHKSAKKELWRILKL